LDSLKAKNIIITGASSGIGEALAIQAAKIGANIVIASRNISKLEELKKSLNSYNTNIITVSCDVTKASECQNLIDTAIRELGSIHVLINNAGISMRASFEDVNLDVKGA
jgi:short-subunit dehydrogenase